MSSKSSGKWSCWFALAGIIASFFIYGCQVEPERTNVDLTGWWVILDSGFTVKRYLEVQHDVASGTINWRIAPPDYDGDEIEGTATFDGHTMVLSGEIEGSSITITMNYHEGYFDGIDPDGEYFRMIRSGPPPDPPKLPTATISIDGSSGDWIGIEPQIVDPIVDHNGCAPWQDIETIRVCKNAGYIAFILDLSGAPVYPLSGNDKFHVYVDVENGHKYEVNIRFSTSMSVYIRDTDVWWTILGEGMLSCVSDRIEFQLNLMDLGNPAVIKVNGGYWSESFGGHYYKTTTKRFSVD